MKTHLTHISILMQIYTETHTVYTLELRIRVKLKNRYTHSISRAVWWSNTLLSPLITIARSRAARLRLMNHPLGAKRKKIHRRLYTHPWELSTPKAFTTYTRAPVRALVVQYLPIKLSAGRCQYAKWRAGKAAIVPVREHRGNANACGIPLGDSWVRVS